MVGWLDSLGVVGRSRVDHPPFVFLNCRWMMDDDGGTILLRPRIGHRTRELSHME